MTERKSQSIGLIDRPRICSIDLEDNVVATLKKLDFIIYDGSLGSKVKVPNARGKSHSMLLNYNLPPNIHEFDIFIIDLNNFKTKAYDANSHIRTEHSGKSETSLISSFPETLFDPRPIVSSILHGDLLDIKDRKFLVIVFSTSDYNLEYEIVTTTNGYPERENPQTYSIYSFWDNIPRLKIMYGKEIFVEPIREDFESLLKSHTKDAFYHQTFSHPTIWKGGESVKIENMVPLMRNLNGDIVSYLELNDSKNFIIFPQFKDKGQFLTDFLTDIAPSIYPELFPFSTKFNWKSDKDYWLPEHQNLINEKQTIKESLESQMTLCDQRIEENIEKYSYLHDLLSETGQPLVSALIKYFNWLGFIDVIDQDEVVSDVLEEDIQVNLSNGLLIIECKGIGGTSTDSDCSQISKIRHRRCRERNKMDVFALYIVNHQRFLPPLKRKEIPFSKDQIQDAINDERGLLTTWQLFNLYFDIENNIITKEEARDAMLNFGKIEFKPQDLTFVDEPTEFFSNGSVCIVNIKNIELNVGDTLYLEKNGKFEIATIQNIHDNGKPINNIKNGECGLKLDLRIGKKTKIWKKKAATNIS